MSDIWITSDTHFAHDKDFIWGKRGYSSVNEMNEALIEKWNSVVKPDDIVYHLGDVMLKDIETGERCLNRLNGTINFILGNHDNSDRATAYKRRGNVLGYSTVICYNKQNIYLSHYPTLTANVDDITKSFRRLIPNLCGHTHTKDKYSDMNKGLIYHVEVDAHDGYPVSLDKAINDIKKYIDRRDK